MTPKCTWWSSCRSSFLTNWSNDSDIIPNCDLQPNQRRIATQCFNEYLSHLRWLLKRWFSYEKKTFALLTHLDMKFGQRDRPRFRSLLLTEREAILVIRKTNIKSLQFLHTEHSRKSSTHLKTAHGYKPRIFGWLLRDSLRTCKFLVLLKLSADLPSMCWGLQ